MNNVSTTFGSNISYSLLNDTSAINKIHPLHLSWNPQEDITTFELAKNMAFLLRQYAVMPHEFDKEAVYARHWIVTDPN